jgi:hypothetical protein
LVLASSYDAPNSSSAMRPVALDETEAPWVFNALRRDQTLVYGQSQWGDDPLLDTLHQALGTSELYPTVLQPITRGEWAHGLLVAQNPYGNEAFSEDEIRLCQVTATRLGAAIARFDGLSGFPLVPGDSETDAESSAAGTAAATSASPATI